MICLLTSWQKSAGRLMHPSLQLSGHRFLQSLRRIIMPCKKLRNARRGCPASQWKQTARSCTISVNPSPTNGCFADLPQKNCRSFPGSLGIIGATPLNTGFTNADPVIRSLGTQEYAKITCFGLDSGLDAVSRASEYAEIMVISPSGLKAAQYLHETFGTPFSVGYPCLPEAVLRKTESLSGKRVLIVHQQFAANTLRQTLKHCDTDCATWFLLDRSFAEPGDFRITDEEMLAEAAPHYDVIIADRVLHRIVPHYSGLWIDFPHDAVSGSAERGTL